MADKLYEISGLVDPSLWGQASNGQIELEFCLPSAYNTEKATAHALAIIAEVSAAGGIEMDWCSEFVQSAGGPATLTTSRAAKPTPECPRLVLHGAHRTTELLPEG